MDMAELGLAIRARRTTLKLTQEAVASANGMSRVTLSKFENGKLPELGIRKVMALCATLGLDLVPKETARRPTLRELVAERPPHA